MTTDGRQDNALLTIEELRVGIGYPNLPADQDPLLASIINAVSDAFEGPIGQGGTSRRLVWRQYANEWVWLERGSVSVGEAAWGSTLMTVAGVSRATPFICLEWPITARPTVTVDSVTQSVWMPGDPGLPTDADVVLDVSRNPTWGLWRLRRWNSWPGRTNIFVTYEAGYGGTDDGSHPLRALAPIPVALKQAAIIMGRELYKLPDRQSIQSFTVQGQATTYIQNVIPKQCLQLLQPFRRIVIGGI